MARSSDVFEFATAETLAKTGVGFVIAVALLALVAAGIGVDRVVQTLADAHLRWIAAGCLSTFLCLLFWGKAWQVVLSVVGVSVPFRRLAVTYFAATFANYVTPLGQAGGEPFIAYVLARDTEASYEDSLASVVTADLLNLLPFFSFAAVGLSVLLWRAQLPAAARPLVLGLFGLAVGVPLVALAGWLFRHAIRDGALRLMAPVVARTDRIRLDSIRRRIDDLYASFERIAAEPRALVGALLFAYLGWVFFALPLYFAGQALDLPLSALLVLFVVPASTLAGIVPSPGGLGGVEVALVVLLLALAPLTAAEAYAVALVYRLASYWFALVIGGVAALWVVRRA
ncbi:MAG: YbhN family protein [Haloarculaceae archaeon]